MMMSIDWYNNNKEKLVWNISRLLKWILAVVICIGGATTGKLQAINMPVLSSNSSKRDISELSTLLSDRTSINDLVDSELKSSDFNNFKSEPMIWVEDVNLISNKSNLKPEVSWWIKRGGFMVITENLSQSQLTTLFSEIGASVESVDLNSELMKSYYLLSTLPQCSSTKGEWKVVMFDERISVVVIPYNYIDTLLSYMKTGSVCEGMSGKNLTRSFINIMLVSLTTDYKNDQTHLPEILKRLR